MQLTADHRLASAALRASNLPVSRASLNRWINTGRVPAVRVGGRWYVRPADLSKLVSTV